MPRHLTTLLLALLPVAVIASDAAAPTPAALAPVDPAQRAQEVLAADRAFAARGAEDFLAAAEAMFAADVTLPLPGGRFANGRADALAALREVPGTVGSTASWAPIRVGVSADGSHAFSYGYMQVSRADGSSLDAKYLSYWVRGADGWKVAAYRRVPRAPGTVETAMREPALPQGSWPQADQAGHLASLVAAEKAFSDRAQSVGLGQAFTESGSEDAMNMGGPAAAEFVFSAAKIGPQVSGGEDGPSPVSWSADRALVAPSGDLGVTFGLIHFNAPDPAAPQPPMAFFTVWRRAAPDAPWRYVAE